MFDPDRTASFIKSISTEGKVNKTQNSPKIEKRAVVVREAQNCSVHSQ